MCFIGAPNPEPRHAEKAFEMACEMQHSVKALSERWQQLNYGLGLGVGISTGIVSTGTIGFEERLDYAAIGSVTNLAARLCGKAAGGEVLISESTYQSLKKD